MNPNGLVPTLVDDGFVLWESHAMLRYIAVKDGPGALYPEDVQVRALADQWMDWVNSIAIPVRRGVHAPSTPKIRIRH